MSKLDRRDLLALGGATMAAAATGIPASAEDSAGWKVHYCLNTSTIRGQELSLPEQVQVAADAGYDGIEPWIRDIEAYRDGGGNLRDLAKRIEDAGLEVASAIGFAKWIVDDPQERAQGLETARRDMDLLRTVGGTRIAAPPAGATEQTDLDLFAAAARYGELLAVGRNCGVLAQLELWGFSQSLSRLGELLFVAGECGDDDACVLPDVYHIYKGGSPFAGLSLLRGDAIHAFHMNDYPDDPPRDTVSDADRVFPGDGVAPLADILGMLRQAGFSGHLSLELFNRDYWKRDPLDVARTGLEKMKRAVASTGDA